MGISRCLEDRASKIYSAMLQGTGEVIVMCSDKRASLRKDEDIGYPRIRHIIELPHFTDIEDVREYFRRLKNESWPHMKSGRWRLVNHKWTRLGKPEFKERNILLARR